jgi:anaerobic magnesium-protoporphyrin IX monomethyl ester cyclase
LLEPPHFFVLSMTILLINSHFNGKSEIPPLGLQYIAAPLLDAGLAVSILDLDIMGPEAHDQVLLETLRQCNPRIIGVTSLSNSFASARQIFQIAKAARPEILTVLGGIHATVLSDSLLLNDPDIDVIVRGEGEMTFAELVGNHFAGRSFDGIPGISFRKGNQIVHQADRPLCRDLDDLPLPAHHLVENSSYRTRSISSSRGCAHSCTFCSIQALYHRVVRTRSVLGMMEEIEGLLHYGARRIMFTDDNFTFDFDRVRDLCGEIIRRGYHRLVAFYAQGRMHDLCRHRLMAGLLSAAGFQALYIGAESGSADILNYYQKKMLPEELLQGVSLCVEQNLTPVVNFILFGPQDTRDTLRQTLRLARQLFENGAEIAYTEALIPYPGTPIKATLEQDGKFREDGDIYYFESYRGLDMSWILQLCDLSRRLAILFHGQDRFFEQQKIYYEFGYLDELLDGRLPADLEKARCHPDLHQEEVLLLYDRAQMLLDG